MNFARILIVEDEEHARKQLAEHFSKRIECEILEAPDAYEAERCLEAGKIDLILTDIRMPGKSGLEVIIKVRESSKDIPIIVLSRLEDASVEEKIKSLGIEIIPKPFPIKVVYEKAITKLKSLEKYFPKTI